MSKTKKAVNHVESPVMPKQMFVQQVEPSTEAKRGLAPGGFLLHFRVMSGVDKDSYYVAVLQTIEMRRMNTYRTGCTCWSAFMGFADADRTPVCKHARAALDFIKTKL